MPKNDNDAAEVTVPSLMARGVCSHEDGVEEHVPGVQIALRGSTIEDIGGVLMPTIVLTLHEAALMVANITMAMADAPGEVCGE